MSEKFVSKHLASEIEEILDFADTGMANNKGFSTNDYDDTEKSKVADAITKSVNDLVNYYTKSDTYSKQEINSLLQNVVNGLYTPVNQLPTEDINTKTIYLVPKTTGSEQDDVKDEYINIDGTSNGWERIGSTRIDLTNYVTSSALNTLLSDKVDKISGKGLSTEDYTTIEKEKLATLRKVTELTGTLVAGETEISFTDNAITTTSKIRLFSNVWGLSPTAVENENHTITLTYDAQDSDVSIIVEVS